MVYGCTERTDLDELIGTEHWQGPRPTFRYGPLALAMMQGEELVLENSAALSAIMLVKLHALRDTLFIENTNESVHSGDGFRLTLR